MAAPSCRCCSRPFSPLRWQYTCAGCQRAACASCCRRLVRGVAGFKVAHLCRGCLSVGVLLRDDAVCPTDTNDLLHGLRRQLAAQRREYDALAAFAVQLECALRRKGEALLELQDLATATPRFEPTLSMTRSVATPQVRRVELHLPFAPSPRGAEDEDEEGWAAQRGSTGPRRRSLGNASAGGQSSVSRRSGDNWEDVADWEEQGDRIQELQRANEHLKKHAAETRHKQEQAELALSTLRETHHRDFDRLMKAELKCKKLETQLSEEQSRATTLQRDLVDAQREGEVLRANLHHMKAMFEAEMDGAQDRIQQLEEKSRGWFSSTPIRPSPASKGRHPLPQTQA